MVYQVEGLLVNNNSEGCFEPKRSTTQQVSPRLPCFLACVLCAAELFSSQLGSLFLPSSTQATGGAHTVEFKVSTIEILHCLVCSMTVITCFYTDAQATIPIEVGS